jgi:potassium efflux system protein
MRLRLLPILLVTGLAAASLSYALPNLPQIESALRGDSEAKTPALPEPAALKPDWWQYFQVEGKELQEHIESTLTRLNALLGELPKDSVDAASSYVELVRANLNLLPEVRAQASAEPPPPLTYKERYTLPQLLDIAERIRVVRVELQAEDYDNTVADRAVRSGHRRIDTLTAAYLNLSPDDPARVLRGLEIMAERSTLAIAEERLRVRRAEWTANQALLRQLLEEQKVASERLVAMPADQTRLTVSIAQAERDLEQAQERLMKDQSKAMPVVGEDPEGKVTQRYRQQRVVRAAVTEAEANVVLLSLQVQQQLVELLLNKGKIDLQGLRRQLADWEGQLGTIRQQAMAWSGDSERERERAAESMTGVVRGIATSVSLINEERLRLAQETLVSLQRLDSVLGEGYLVIQLLDGELKHKEGWLQNWLARATEGSNRLWQSTEGWFSTSLFKIGDTPVTPLGLLRIIFILSLAWGISYGLRHALKRLGERRQSFDSAALYTIGRLSHYVIITIGFIVGLSSIGIDFTNFALLAGAIAIGIGFGMQSIVNNFVSGLILLFERSLKVGDFVEMASGVAGEVREISVRSTLITTNDNVDIVVPNSEFINTKVTNWTLLEGNCRIHLSFRVAYGTDKELVRQAGLEAAERVPYTLTGVPGRNPAVWLVGFGENGLQFELVVWIAPRAVKRPSAVRAAYMWEIETALSKYGIEIPFPQRELRLRSGFAEGHQNKTFTSLEVKP